MNMFEKVEQAVEWLSKKGFLNAHTGIILGTGLGGLVDEIDVEATVEYQDIPHFPISTVESHKGHLILGKLNGIKVIAMQGRFHYYEGYSMAEVVFPVRVLEKLGIKNLIISNAAGNMNLNWKKGELMLITDHINMLPDNPLRGNDASKFGNIFTDMSQPYNDKLNQILIDIANQENIKLNQGVYVAVAGPSLETRAEYRFLRNAGADIVGMSTVPEVIAANQLGLPVAAISVLTDDCDPDNLHPINISDIIATAKSAEKQLIALINGAISKF
jgi:purine-nucleoside phosphorylase